MSKNATYHWLPPKAVQFLKDNVLMEKRTLRDYQGSMVELEIPVKRRIATYGLFHAQELHEYSLKNNKVATEYLQATVKKGKVHHYYTALAIQSPHDDVNVVWSKKQIGDE